MEIKYGAEVVDKKGEKIGTIDYLVRDTYTGDIRKFKVSTELIEADLFYSPDDILEYSDDQVKLKTTFGKPNNK